MLRLLSCGALLWALSCRGSGEPAPAPAPTPAGTPPAGGTDRDQGQKSPPIPAENPAWSWDAGGFVSDVGWYGEATWADVAMRAVGHLAMIGRDRARLAASQGDLSAAAARMGELVSALEAAPVAPAGVSRRVADLLLQSARRDQALLQALAAGGAAPEAPGLAGQRARYLALARRPDAPALQGLLAELEAPLPAREDLDIDAFADFEERHELRVRLFEAWAESVDPIGFSEPWGYWTGAEIGAQRDALAAAARALLAAEAARPPELAGVDPIRWPSLLYSGDGPAFSAEELGALPTGDSYIDVAGQPGPRAIGRLERLGLEDAEHRAWLEAQAQELSRLIEEDPLLVPERISQMVLRLDAHGHGSRYYNIKAVRNAGVRQLARAGQPALALKVLRQSWPLHHQDWACPNREGILRGIEGRLLAVAGDPGAAAALEQAWSSTQAFIAQVRQAEAVPGQGLRPPAAGGVPPSAQRPPGRPPGQPPPQPR